MAKGTPINKEVILNITAKANNLELQLKNTLAQIQKMGLGDNISKSALAGVQKLIEKTQELKVDMNDVTTVTSKMAGNWSKSFNKLSTEVGVIIAKLESTDVDFGKLTGDNAEKFKKLKANLNEVLAKQKEIAAQARDNSLFKVKPAGVEKATQIDAYKALGNETELNRLLKESESVILKKIVLKEEERRATQRLIEEEKELIEVAKLYAAGQDVDGRKKPGRLFKDRKNAAGLGDKTNKEAADALMISSQASINLLGKQYGKSSKDVDSYRQSLNALTPYFEKVIAYSRQYTESMQKLSIPLDEATRDLDEFSNEMSAIKTSGVEKASVELKEAGSAAKEAAVGAEGYADALETVETKSQMFKNMQMRIAQLFGLASAFQFLRRFVSAAAESIKELDKAFVEIAVVTDFTTGELWESFSRYNTMAQQLGVRTTDAIETSALYYQQGLETVDVMVLTTQTIKMARIAGMDFAAATQAMTAAIRGFSMEMSAAQLVTDTYSALAAEAAVDTQQLATAMSKTASIAGSAGMAFESTSAYLTKIIETTQEAPETAGTALKTIIARFTELTKSPLAIQIDVEGEEVNANKIEKSLRLADVALRDTEGQFRDLDTVFMELAGKWDTLDRNTQRHIATVAAGSRQQSRFIAMMSDYDRTVQLMDIAYDAAGAGSVQFAKTLDSVQASLNKLKSSFEALVGNLVQNKTVKAFLDTLNQGMRMLVTVSEKGILMFGVVMGILAMTIKNALTLLFGSFATLSKKVEDWKVKAKTPVIIPIDADFSSADAKLRAFQVQAGQGPISAGQTFKKGNIKRITKLDKVDPSFPKVFGGMFSGLIASSILSGIAVASATGNVWSGLLISFSQGIIGVLNNPEMRKAISDLAIPFGKNAGTAAAKTVGTVIKSVGVALKGVIPVIGLGLAITGIMYGLNKWSDPLERAKRKASQLHNELDAINETVAASEAQYLAEKLKLDDLQDDINEYDALNKIISKTADEQRIFNELSNKLGTDFPQLIQTYDELGNAVLKQKELWGDISEIQDDIVVNAAKIYATDLLTQLATDIDTIMADYRVWEEENNKETPSSKSSGRVGVSNSGRGHGPMGQETPSLEIVEQLSDETVLLHAKLDLASVKLANVIKQIAGIDLDKLEKVNNVELGKEVKIFGQEYISQEVSQLVKFFQKVQEESAKTELSQVEGYANLSAENLKYLNTIVGNTEKATADMLHHTDFNTFITDASANLTNGIWDMLSGISTSSQTKLELLFADSGTKTTESFMEAVRRTIDASEGFYSIIEGWFKGQNSKVDDLISDAIGSEFLDEFLAEFSREDVKALSAKYGDDLAKELLASFYERLLNGALTPEQVKILLASDLSTLQGAQDTTAALHSSGLGYNESAEAAAEYSKVIDKTTKINTNAIKSFKGLQEALRKTNTLEKYANEFDNLYSITEEIADQIKEDLPGAGAILDALTNDTITYTEAQEQLKALAVKKDYTEISEGIRSAKEAFKEGGGESDEFLRILDDLGISSEVFAENQELLTAYMNGNTEAVWGLVNAYAPLQNLKTDSLNQFSKSLESNEIAVRNASAETLQYIRLLQSLGLVKVEQKEVSYIIGSQIGPSGRRDVPVYGTRMIDVLVYDDTKTLPKSGATPKTTKTKKEKEPYQSKVDANYNLIREIEDLNRSLRKLQEERNNILDPALFEANTKAILDSLNSQLGLYNQYQTRLVRDQEALTKEIKDLKIGGAITVSGGELFTNRTAILRLSEETQKSVDKMIDEWENLDKAIIDNESAIRDNEKALMDLRKAAEDAFIKSEEKIIQLLIAKDEKEIQSAKDKYAELKKADEDYLNALRKNIDKRRAARDKENAYGELEKKERRLSLLKRDTSGIYAVEILALEQEIADARIELADREVDDQLDKLEEANQNRSDAYDKEMENLDNLHKDKLDSMEWYNKEANRIMQLGQQQQLEWLKTNDLEFLKASETAQRRYIEEWQKTFNTANSMGAITAVTSDPQAMLSNAISVLSATKGGVSASGTYMEGAQNISSHNPSNAFSWYDKYIKTRQDIPDNVKDLFWMIVKAKYLISGESVPARPYKKGGIVDYTGLAAVHGSANNPEAFLSSADTKNITMLKDILSGVFSGASRPNVGADVNNTKMGDCYIEVNVDSIGSDYDVDQAVDRIKELMLNSASYRNINLINRTR